MTPTADARERESAWPRALAGILLGGYLVIVAFVVFWPTPVDRFFDLLLLRAASSVRSHVAVWLAYEHVEFLGNVLLFLPLGVGLAAVLPKAMHWLVPFAALVSSTVIEVVQFTALPDRFGGPVDVVANVLGAAIGWAGVLIVRASRPNREKKVTRRQGLARYNS